MGLISKIYGNPQYRRELYTENGKPPTSKRPIMRWTQARYEVSNGYELRESLKSTGFRFDPDTTNLGAIQKNHKPSH